MSKNEKKSDVPDETPVSRGTSRKRRGISRKKRRLYYTLIVFFLLVMAFSLFMLVKQIIGYRQASSAYNDIKNDPSIISTKPEPAQTEPLPSESASVPDETQPSETGTEETQEQPTETEEPSTEPPAPDYGLSDITVNFVELKGINRDVVGFIQGLGDELMLPVVQGNDNEYYLDHMFNKEPNSCGAIFVDYRNRFLKDDITYLYGHHMINYQMFGCLKRYDKQEFYDNNPILKLHTPSGVVILRPYAVIHTNTGEWLPMNFSGEQEFNQVFASYARRSVVRPAFSVSYGDKFVCLYTCSYHVTDGRYLVICRIE